MLTLFMAILGVGLFAAFMSLGLILRGKELKGTCASQSAALMEDGVTCGVCGKPVGACESDNNLQTNISNPK